MSTMVLEERKLEKIPEALAELETTAVLSGRQVDAKTICEKWILVTYDLPHTEAGDKARREFLEQLKKLGGCQHTESVYLLPYTAAAGEACLELAKIGKLVVWSASPTDLKMAEEITRNYDVELKKMLAELSRRVDRMIELRLEDKLGIRNKMVDKTDEMIRFLGEAVLRREALDLAIIYQAIVKRYEYA